MLSIILIFLIAGFSAVHSKPLPTSLPSVAKIHDQLHIALGGAISAKQSTGKESLTEVGLQSSGRVSQMEATEGPIVIQKRDGSTETLDKDKVRISDLLSN
jgi:hypothetical protein